MSIDLHDTVPCRVVDNGHLSDLYGCRACPVRGRSGHEAMLPFLPPLSHSHLHLALISTLQ
jgi:hypothetical protein